MKVIVIGLGSMGKRRIRLIQKLDSAVDIIGVDSRQDRKKEAAETYGILVEDSLQNAIDRGADCAFVCTSPLSHAGLIHECLKHRLHVFTEINLVDAMYDENIALAKENGCVLFLSSTFLYRDEIKYIQKEVRSANSRLTYAYHIGQYLPDWHPWESYNDYFVGDVRTNGCREIMAIDFPWIYKTFGKVRDVQVRRGRKTSLNINYNDSYLLMLEHENGIQGTVLVDVVSRKAVRNLEIFGEDLYIAWDGTAEGVKKFDIESRQEVRINLYDSVDRQGGYAAFVVENAYTKEIESFFDEIKNGQREAYGFEDDKYVLRLIDQIEGVSREDI